MIASKIKSHQKSFSCVRRLTCTYRPPNATLKISHSSKSQVMTTRRARLEHNPIHQARMKKVDRYRETWRSDEHLSSRWNVLNIMLLFAMMSPLVGLGFAWVGYGWLWALGPV